MDRWTCWLRSWHGHRRWLVGLGACASVMGMLTMVVTGLIGCAGGSAVTDGQIHAADPQTTIESIARAAEAGDRSAVPDLVEQLASDDPAVRMYAIMALERLEGTRHGYSPYARPTERQAAINRWLAALGESVATETPRNGAAMSTTPTASSAAESGGQRP